MKNHQINKDDEIDLKDIFMTFWHAKVFILIFSCASMFFASMYLQDAERLHLVEHKLKPVGDTQKNNSFSGLNGFASLAGIELPSNSTNDLKIFKELIFSVEVSEIIIKNNKLIKKIYDSEWNPLLNSFSQPSKSKYRIYIDFFKKTLTGSNEVNYIPPNARRLAIYISKNIIISEDKNTGFLTLKAKTSKPDLLSSLISEAIEASDQIMRQRYINFSQEPLSFYKQKLRIARSREHREALAELISREEQKLMFASRGKYFTAEPYIDSKISLYPIAPKPMLILIFSIMFGTFLGCIIVLLRKALMKVK